MLHSSDDIFLGHGVEIRLKSNEDFLKIKETLTRIGVINRRTKTVYQSCHILHKRGRYRIVHFKELYALDKGRSEPIETEDIARRNSIANRLAEWNLLDLVEPEYSQDPVVDPHEIRVLSFNQKMSGDWNLVSKYNIGGKE